MEDLETDDCLFSSTMAEFQALTATTTEIIWLRLILADLGVSPVLIPLFIVTTYELFILSSILC